VRGAAEGVDGRFVGSFFFQPSYLWGVGIGGVLTLESGLPLFARETFFELRYSPFLSAWIGP